MKKLPKKRSKKPAKAHAPLSYRIGEMAGYSYMLALCYVQERDDDILEILPKIKAMIDDDTELAQCIHPHLVKLCKDREWELVSPPAEMFLEKPPAKGVH
jgi:hypothetical protein